VCAFHHYEVNNPRKARLRIKPDEKEIFFRSYVCVQCPDAKCIEACPEEALNKDEQGVTVFHDDKCTECLQCIEACPFDAILYHEDTGILKCDLCGACVPECPNQALTIKSNTVSSAK
jgi:Fe-S-cluster-containing dehydrogenase component